MSNLKEAFDETLEICRKNNWKRDWSAGGCYLHLEVSEFIESLRGKGTNQPASEAGDVLFVLFSTAAAAGLKYEDMILGLERALAKARIMSKQAG